MVAKIRQYGDKYFRVNCVSPRKDLIYLDISHREYFDCNKKKTKHFRYDMIEINIDVNNSIYGK